MCVYLQCVRRLADESRADEGLVASLWVHEVKRIIRDRICRHADRLWFDETLQEIIQEVGENIFVLTKNIKPSDLYTDILIT